MHASFPQDRRGFEKANIYSISFSANAQWLAVSSDKGTVHVFSINVGRQDGTIRESNITVTGSPSRLIVNPGSSLSFMKSKKNQIGIYSLLKLLN
jgi:WD40 repeat protein